MKQNFFFDRLRRRLLINPTVQLTMLAHTVVVAGISVIGVHLSYFRQSVDEIYIYGIGIVSTSSLMYLPFIGLFICILWGFAFSNRIVGPIYRIENQLRAMSENGETTEIRCRKKDYFTSMVSALNSYISNQSKAKNSKGFSLIELMIAVAIIGMLAAIAIPNFNEFAKRARHAEAKTNLSAIYSAEKAYQAEYQMYSSVLNSIGFSTNGFLYFNVGFDYLYGPAPDAPPGTPSCLSVCPKTNCGSYATWECIASALNSLDGTVIATATSNTFRATAHAHFTPSPSDAYTFSIDHNKRLSAHFPPN